MIRGEFLIMSPDGSEIIVPNQFTIYGAQLLFRTAFGHVGPSNLAVGLCAHNPADNIALAAVQEPTPGVNGYQRQSVPMNPVNWPKVSVVNNESYIETREFTFALSGAVDVAVNRLFITDGTYVVSISSAFKEGLTYRATPLITKYRLWLR